MKLHYIGLQVSFDAVLCLLAHATEAIVVQLQGLKVAFLSQQLLITIALTLHCCKLCF